MLLLAPFFVLAQADDENSMRVTKATYYAKSKPLTELAARLMPDKEDAIDSKNEVHNKFTVEKWEGLDLTEREAIIQTKMGERRNRGPIAGFAGQGNTGVSPPDTDGDVSETHFVQMVNSRYNVYEKDGTKILGPLNLSELWAELPGGPWGNSGDPIVVYDEDADRWILTQFAPRNNYTQNYELFAVSATSDPTGEYHLYAFYFGNQFNDYPKVSVWTDGYYATYNMFRDVDGDDDLDFLGGKITAVEREKMLIGDPDAAMVDFFKSGYYSNMPADIDGDNLPEEGEPCPVMYINGSQQLEIWNFAVNWETPSASTLSKQNPNISVSNFIRVPNDNGVGNGIITQPGTSQKLDGLGAMIMNRLAYRKFDTHESMVVNHSVVVSNTAAIRWYELRKTDGLWELYQEGTFAPNDGIHRWMGSMAMNANGDIALGYSASNSEVYPSIRYTGRFADDPLGEMTFDEIELKAGTSSQGGSYRWGDYSCMNVDPSNDTEFWYTTEYNGWQTWISSFDLNEITGATAFAGEDGYTCTNNQFQTNGSGTAVQSIQWTTDGDGFFTDADEFSATYIRGSQDVANHGCTLTMTAIGFDGVEVSDDMYLNIVPWVDAGEDATIFVTESFQVEAEGTEYGSIEWSTSGDGSFNDPNIMQPIYTPGDEDLANGEVELSVTVAITEPCTSNKSDDMMLYFDGVGIDEIQNNSRLEIFPNPTEGVFTLNLNGLQAGEEFTYYLYTGYGKKIYTEAVTAKSYNYQKVINMSDFKAGVYFVNIQTSNGDITKKVIKK